MGRRPADTTARRTPARWFCITTLAACLSAATQAFANDQPNGVIGPHPHVAEVVATPLDSSSAAMSPDDAAPAIESLPIGPVKNPDARSGDAGADRMAGPSATRTIGALGIVIVLIFATRWGMRKAATRVGGMSSQLGPGGRAPSGVLTVLARYPVGRGQSLVLLQVDQRVLLLNQSAQGFQTLAEITDPEEVASLLIKTRDEENDSLATRFTGLLKRFERDPEIVDRNEWPSRNPTTVDAAMRLFPNATPERTDDGPDPLAAIRRRVADLEGTLA